MSTIDQARYLEKELRGLQAQFDSQPIAVKLGILRNWQESNVVGRDLDAALDKVVAGDIALLNEDLILRGLARTIQVANQPGVTNRLNALRFMLDTVRRRRLDEEKAAKDRTNEEAKQQRRKETVDAYRALDRAKANEEAKAPPARTLRTRTRRPVPPSQPEPVDDLTDLSEGLGR